VLQGPRLLFSKAERGELPAVLARVHPRFHTPDIAIVVFSAVGFALAAAGTFEGTATLSAIVRLVTYGLTCAALPILRRRSEAAGFRVPGGFRVALAAMLFCLWLLLTRSFAQAWVLVGLMVLGWVLRAIPARGTARRS
jgi:amino acid transporter